MSNVSPNQIGEAIQAELSLYSREVTEQVNQAAKASAQKLVKLTKANAPVGYRKAFKKAIAMKEVDGPRGHKKYVWHAKAPEYRLVHLLVRGHATRDGGRTQANPFLQDALDVVLPEFERAVEEAVQNG